MSTSTVFVLNAGSLELTRWRFSALPIRIGRNTLNDCPIVHQLISNFHARIDDVGGKLCVEDLGSKNGVYVVPPGGTGHQRLAPHQPMDIAPSGFEFFLSPQVKITVAFEAQRDALDERAAASFSGSVVGNRGMLLSATPPSAGPVPLAPPRASAPPGAASFPSQAPPPGAHFSGGVAPLPGRHVEGTGFFNDLQPEFLALQGLRELAASLVPGVMLETTGDVARFITKVHDALDTFLRSAIPMREGYSQFVSSLDLQRSQRRGVQRSAASAAVEAATTPQALAQALLNPTDRSFDAPRALEGIFADLMLHQMAMLEGVMRGVRALLEELSPENIANQTGHGFPLGRHKAYWEAYCQRFEDLYEERQTFAVIFGPEFAAAYRRYRQGGPDGETGG